MAQSSISTRGKEILRILSEDSGLSVSAISKLLGVSTVTVRSDLNSLADKGLIVRTKGGALPAFHQSILERQRRMTHEKNRIARAAAEQVNDGDNIMIVAGTTTALIAKYLLGKRDIHVVTNSTLLFPYARVNPLIRVTLVGGEFRPSAEAMVGPIALRELQEFHVNTAFVGADGFSLETGLTADLVEIAEIVKQASRQAHRSILAADSQKYGKAGFARILPLTSVDMVITDTGLSESVGKLLRKSGLSLETV